MPAGLYVLDIGKQRVLRGSILSGVSGTVTTITWYDLSNPVGPDGKPGSNPFVFRGGGANIINVSVEQMVSGITIPIVLSNQDSQPTSTPTANFVELGRAVDAPASFGLNLPWRWIGAYCTVYGGGSNPSVYVYGVLP